MSRKIWWKKTGGDFIKGGHHLSTRAWVQGACPSFSVNRTVGLAMCQHCGTTVGCSNEPMIAVGPSFCASPGVFVKPGNIW